MPCKLEAHPLIVNIDEMLRKEEISYGAIIAFVESHGGPSVEKHQLSRHAMGDLQLPPRGPRKKQKAEVADMANADLSEIIEEGLKIAYWRMKNKPEDVTTPALLTFLTQAMKLLETKDKSTDLDKKLTQVMGALQA